MKKAIVFAAFLLLALPGCRASEQWIKTYGYTPLRPASTLLMPGAIIMHSGNKNDGTKLVCSAQASLGRSFVPMESNTVTGKFRRSRKMSWRVSGDVLSQAKANVNASDVDEVYVTVTGARILHVDDELIYINLNNRSAACKAAIEARKLAGYSLSMVKSALVADVTYNLKFSNAESLDVDVKVAQAANMAVGLGGTVDRVTETTASANNLVWGIQEDMFLAAISISPEDAKRYKRNTRLLPDNFVIEATPAADDLSQIGASHL